MKQHFEISHVKKYDNILSRDTVSRQLMKICYACSKGFVKRKGRTRAFPVSNEPGRWVCQKCADAIVSGKTNKRLRLL